RLHAAVMKCESRGSDDRRDCSRQRPRPRRLHPYPPSRTLILHRAAVSRGICNSPSADEKSTKLSRTPLAVSFDFADHAVHPLFDGRDEPRHLAGLPLRFQLNPTVREILHKSSHLKFFRHLHRAVTEPDALHVTREKHRFVMYLRHNEGVELV